MFQSAINSFRRGGSSYRGGHGSSSWNKRRAAPQHLDAGEEYIVGTIDNPPSTPGLHEPGSMPPPPPRTAPAATAHSGDQPAKKSKLGESLAEAARAGDLDVVKKLVEEEDCDVDQKCIGCTALHYSVFYRHTTIAEYLVAMGADLNCRDLSGQTPLHWAVERDNPQLVKYLLECEAQADARDNSGATALHKAVLKGNATVIRHLIELGRASLNLKTKDEAGGNAPLHEAAAAGQTDVVQVLLAHKVDANVKNAQGKTPMMRAIAKNREAVVKMLVECSDLNAADTTGRTALHWAAFYGHEEILRTLLARHANAHLRDKAGTTALDIAKRRELPGVIRLLGGTPTEDDGEATPPEQTRL